MLIRGLTVKGIEVRSTSSAISSDEYFNLVSLLLPGTGTNGAQNNTFLDSSTNNFTVTRAGNTTQGTFSPFSQTGWSNYFDGSGDTLQITPSSPLDFGTGDFTVEFWAWFNDISVDRGFIGSSATLGYDFCWRTSTGLNIGRINTAFDNTFAWTPTVGVWYHIVYCRSGTSLRVFVNGTQIGSTATNSISYNSATTFIVGGSTTADRLFLGYLSNMRLIKGTALYTSNFTPPTAPLTAISGTSLLTCQSNRFVDNSANAFAITVNGNTAVQAFAPFDPTTAYSAGTVGGSGYFDGTGDYLSSATNSAFDFGSGAFTIEAWVYINSFPAGGVPTYGLSTLYASGDSDVGTDVRILVAKGSSLGGYTDGVVLTINSTPIATSGSFTFNANTWYHVAVTRSSNSIYIFIDGVLKSTTTYSSAFPTASTYGPSIGATQYRGAPSYLLTGYISGLRVLKGTAQYTATFTPPTAPLTAIANTSLLLNFTNGGIIDSAAKNVLETVGGAAISTAQSKFGGSSMAFDGSGDYLLLPSSLNFVFGSGDWTVELFVYLNATGRQGFVTLENNIGTNVPWEVGLNASNKFRVLVQTSDGQVIIDGTTTPSTGTWYHIAAVRYGGTVTLYVNGASEATGNVSTNALVAETNSAYIGIYAYGFPLNGYIDDLRITKGYARYTSNFTPPTQAFPTQ